MKGRLNRMTRVELDAILAHVENWLRRASHESIEGFGGPAQLLEHAKVYIELSQLTACDDEPAELTPGQKKAALAKKIKSEMAA